ncbi:MAG: zinc ribbon domain-containing protein [Oscillospiraceae bacterium]|nr:zinc ribbon domain-containing protein [Oscillospiraceae bacterium]
MSIKFEFKRPDTHRRVTDLTVSYGGYCGRKIVFNGTSLRFRNIASPLMVYEKFPKGFFEERVRVLTPVEAKKLARKLCTVDVSTWKSDEHIKFLNDSMIHTNFWCRYSDGWEFRYESAEQPPESFKKLVSMLTAYCDEKAVSASEKRETQAKGRICPSCGKLIPAEANYCPYCGDRQPDLQQSEMTAMALDLDETLFICKKCENTVRYEYSFCHVCGSKLN